MKRVEMSPCVSSFFVAYKVEKSITVMGIEIIVKDFAKFCPAPQNALVSTYF
jgi:hypothetical protein